MSKVFKNESGGNLKSVIDIIRNSLDVGGDGVVRFRTRTGRGSGKAFELPGDQLSEFITLMNTVNDNYTDLVNQENSIDDSQTENDVDDDV